MLLDETYTTYSEVQIVELGADDDKEVIAHRLMAQTGHIFPGGDFLQWQEITALTKRAIEINRTYVCIPPKHRHLFTVARSCRP